MLEICEGGDMFDWLMRMGGSVPEFVAKTNMRQILEAVAFIHKMGFIHRDLKVRRAIVNGHERFGCSLPPCMVTDRTALLSSAGKRAHGR